MSPKIRSGTSSEVTTAGSSALSGGRRLATDTLWSLGAEGAALVSMTLAFLLLSTTLGKAGYGKYVGLFAVIGPFTAVTNGGTALAVLQHIAQHKERAADVARSALGIVLSFGLLFAAMSATITLLAIDGIGVVPVAALCVSELVLGATNYVMSAVVQATDGVVSAMKLRIIGHALRVGVVVSLKFAGALRLVPYAIVTLIVATVYAVILVRKVVRMTGGGRLVGRPSRAHLGSVATYSVGLTGLAVQNDGDKFALSAYGYDDDAGRYGAAYRLVQMGLLPVTALAGATHLSFLRTDDDSNQLRRAYRLSKLSTIYGVVAAAVLWFAAPLAPRLLDDFDGTASIIRWLVPLVFLRGTGTFAMNGLLGLGYNKLRTGLLVGNAVFASLLYLLAVRNHSWQGAVFGTLVSESTLFIAAWACLLILQRRAERDSAVPVSTSEVSNVMQAESDVIVAEQW